MAQQRSPEVKRRHDMAILKGNIAKGEASIAEQREKNANMRIQLGQLRKQGGRK